MNAIDSLRFADMKPMAEMLDFISLQFRNMNLSLPGLAVGTTSAAAVKIANTLQYKAGGYGYSKSSAEIAFTAGAASNIATGYEQCFMLTLDKSGNGLLVPGAPSLGAGTALVPERPADGLCPIGMVRVFNNSGSAFTAGTTLLSAAGITATYSDDYLTPLTTGAQ